MFHTIPEQGKISTSKQSIPEQHGLYFLTLFLTLKFSRPTVFSQSMSSTKSKWLFCLPNFCWAHMAICPMRYVAVLLCSRAAKKQFFFFLVCRNFELIPGQHKLLKLTPSHCIRYFLLLLYAMDSEISCSHLCAGSIS
jgi:hypothetical protein